MAQTVEEARKLVEAVTSGFWQGKVPCWQMCHCSEAIKNECPAARHTSFPCWEIEGTYCKLSTDGSSGKDISICRQCRVYKRWGQNRPIDLKLFGKGIDSFLRSLEEKTGEVLPGESAPFPGESKSPGLKEQAFSNILRRRHEMYVTMLDEIIDKRNGNGGSLTEILKDIQDECDWLPVEALDHVSKRLELPSTKVYRKAIFGKGLSIIPRDRHRLVGNVCVVALLMYYLDFLRHDLCGKCFPCREGMHQMYYIVADIARGEGDEASLDLLKEAAQWVAQLSACNQGTIAANIVLTTLSDFRDQFEIHLNGQKCPAGVCALSLGEAVTPLD